MEMSYLSIFSRKVPANLTVLYLQLISAKGFGKTNDINSEEVKRAIHQIQYGFFFYTGTKLNFERSLLLNRKICTVLTTELLEADVFTSG